MINGVLLLEIMAYFLAGMVFWRFHSLRVQSSLAVTKTGSTGWKARARTPSKWLRKVYLAFHVFRNDSLFTDIYEEINELVLNNIWRQMKDKIEAKLTS